MSIKSVQKRTRGQHGRASPTGVSDFKTWDAFEEEFSYVWKNAREYNEDGSEMYELANDFEVGERCRLCSFLDGTNNCHRTWLKRALQKQRKRSRSRRACASRSEERQSQSRASHSISANTAIRQRLRTAWAAIAPLNNINHLQHRSMINCNLPSAEFRQGPRNLEMARLYPNLLSMRDSRRHLLHQTQHQRPSPKALLRTALLAKRTRLWHFREWPARVQCLLPRR